MKQLVVVAEPVYYITRHALTRGVVIRPCRLLRELGDKHLCTPDNSVSYRIGKEIFEEKEDAIERVNAMKLQRKKALLTELKRLEEPVKWVQWVEVDP